MSARYQTRETLQKAVEHRAKLKAYYADVTAGKQGAQGPDGRRRGEELRARDGRRAPVHRAGRRRRSTCEGLAELSLDFDLPLVILDAREAWTMTGRLARAKISVDPHPAPARRGRQRADAVLRGRRAAGASRTRAKLEAAGVPWCVRSLSPFVEHGRDRGPRPHAAQHGRRVHGARRRDRRGGAARRHARRPPRSSRSRTASAACEAGKDADITISDLDPLDYRSFAEIVLVNGKIVYEKDKVLVLQPHPDRPVEGPEGPVVGRAVTRSGGPGLLVGSLVLVAVAAAGRPARPRRSRLLAAGRGALRHRRRSRSGTARTRPFRTSTARSTRTSRRATSGSRTSPRACTAASTSGRRASRR